MKRLRTVDVCKPRKLPGDLVFEAAEGDGKLGSAGRVWKIYLLPNHHVRLEIRTRSPGRIPVRETVSWSGPPEVLCMALLEAVPLPDDQCSFRLGGWRIRPLDIQHPAEQRQFRIPEAIREYLLRVLA